MCYLVSVRTFYLLLTQVRPEGARRVLEELDRARGSAFLGAVLGVLVALAVWGALHLLWRRSIPAARVAAACLLALATANLGGLVILFEETTGEFVGAAAAWAILAVALGWVHRERLPVPVRAPKPWLKVRLEERKRQRPEEKRPKRERDEAMISAREMRLRALDALERGEAEEAISLLRRSIETKPTKRAYTELGTILGARKACDEATSALNRALELDPGFVEALEELALVLEGAGRKEEAEGLKKRLREAKAEAEVAVKSGPERPRLQECPSCGRPVPGGAPEEVKVCECGLSLVKCSKCGREGAALVVREGALVCSPCRLREAAEKMKGPRRLKEAISFKAVPPWITAVTFAGAVLVGAALSPVYMLTREALGYAALSGVLEELVSAAGGEPAPGEKELSSLEARLGDCIESHRFLKRRAPILKTYLALHAMRRACEMEAEGEQRIASWARRWARSRAEEALAASKARDRTRLPGGLRVALDRARTSFSYEEMKKRALAAAVSTEAPPPPEPEVRRSWVDIFEFPGAGEARFFVESFRRMPEAAAVRLPVRHRDGSALAPEALFECIMRRKAEGEGFVLLMERVPFEAELLDSPPAGLLPACRLVPSEGAPEGRFRMELSERLEFTALWDVTGGEAGEDELLLVRKALFATKRLPLSGAGGEGGGGGLPVLMMEIGQGWEEDELLLWPYPNASVLRGPAVKQVARWWKGRVAVAWHLWYEPPSGDYARRVIQSWRRSRPWWDFYDDGERFFRTVFGDRDNDSKGEGREE